MWWAFWNVIDQFENGASFILIAEVIHISVCRFDTATMFFANVFGKPDHGVSIFHSSANGHRFTLVEISNSLNSSSEMMIEELVFQSKVLFESSVQYNRSVSVGCVFLLFRNDKLVCSSRWSSKGNLYFLHVFGEMIRLWEYSVYFFSLIRNQYYSPHLNLSGKVRN